MMLCTRIPWADDNRRLSRVSTVTYRPGRDRSVSSNMNDVGTSTACGGRFCHPRRSRDQQHLSAAVLLAASGGLSGGLLRALDQNGNAIELVSLDLHRLDPDVVAVSLSLEPPVRRYVAPSRGANPTVPTRADFGLSPLALYSSRRITASQLKTRKHLLPGSWSVLTARLRTDFLDDDPLLVVRLSNTNGNVERKLPAIQAWTERAHECGVRRAALIERLAIGRKELTRLNRFGQVVETGRRTQGWHRRHAAETPALKPRIYYRAVDRYERVRTAWPGRDKPSADQYGVRILGYHRISDDDDVLAVRRDEFRRQMEAVLACGGHVVRLDAAVDLLTHPLEGLYICVTFDDGYRDTLDYAAPVLRELGIPATVFLPTAMIDGRMTYSWYRGVPPASLDWDGVTELVADGSIDVQSHSRTHPRLPALDERRAFAELSGSKDDIERHVGTPVSSFCYPAGLYGPRDAKLVLESGYRSAVTCRPGLNQTGVDPTQLFRNLVGWSDDLQRFTAKLAGRLDTPSRLTGAMQRWRAK